MNQITPLEQIFWREPGHKLIANQTWIRNLRRECIGMSDAMIDELLIGVKVVGAVEKDLTESEV